MPILTVTLSEGPQHGGSIPVHVLQGRHEPLFGFCYEIERQERRRFSKPRTVTDIYRGSRNGNPFVADYVGTLR